MSTDKPDSLEDVIASVDDLIANLIARYSRPLDTPLDDVIALRARLAAIESKPPISGALDVLIGAGLALVWMLAVEYFRTL